MVDTEQDCRQGAAPHDLLGALVTALSVCSADWAGNVDGGGDCKSVSRAKACIATIGWPDGGGKVPLATHDVGSTGCTSGWPLVTAGVATVGSTCGNNATDGWLGALVTA